jgi:sec-independent protein translocase protein TatB
MFDIGWPELMIVFVVALLVIGPRDLPKALHKAGKWVRQARAMASDFQRGLDKVVEEADLKEARDKLRQATLLNPHNMVKDAVMSHLDVGGTLTATATAMQGEKQAMEKALSIELPATPPDVNSADILAEMAEDSDVLRAPAAGTPAPTPLAEVSSPPPAVSPSQLSDTVPPAGPAGNAP